MRIYFPLTKAEVLELQKSGTLAAKIRIGIAATEGFKKTVETDDEDELELIASLSAGDLSESAVVITVVDATAVVVEDEMGEVEFDGEIRLIECECLMLADVESQELSWFGIQEIDQVVSALA
ncbi:MAG: hypothetical protein NT032_07255 [Actinobacteria bacterium]|nr:hypothetical protein [Actinomycetota bacterium]